MASEEYVGDTSVQSIINAIWDMMMRGINILVCVDGLSYEEQGSIGHMFNTLQSRSNAEWFGDLDKKAACCPLGPLSLSRAFKKDRKSLEKLSKKERNP